MIRFCTALCTVHAFAALARLWALSLALLSFLIIVSVVGSRLCWSRLTSESTLCQTILFTTPGKNLVTAHAHHRRLFVVDQREVSSAVRISMPGSVVPVSSIYMSTQVRIGGFLKLKKVLVIAPSFVRSIIHKAGTNKEPIHR